VQNVEGRIVETPLFRGRLDEGERMLGSMKNDDAALVKEMKSGPSRKKKVKFTGGVENRRVATKAGWILGGCREEKRELIPSVRNNSVPSLK